MNKTRITLLFSFLLVVFISFGCSDNDAIPTITVNPTLNANTASIAAPSTTKNSTLMIYMIGSDLEARGGSGTKDLIEMEESGVDLSDVNVVVYTGGAAHWHNETVTKEEHHLLELGKDGFASVKTFERASMGNPEPLCDFLNYAYENYPAENYSLILWDHGSGPVIGYGMDMLYDNDSLTLSEMRKALENSPFKESNKLSFIGFDACLMASAELACVLCDYADYLFASQEVEPSFGWNYSFLESLGKCDTVALGEKIIDSYLSECEKYYEKKGYKNCDTTLSLTDLSLADELCQSIDALFALANNDVTSDYNLLATKRIDTRALGRASTGSEYDIVDLADMAKKLGELYGAESAALLDVIEKMVIINGNNTEDCCGMSLYYPFYNKYYFETSWNDIYTELGIFENYQEYLKKYQKIWLDNDKLEEVTALEVPKEVDEGKYTLRLTNEQLENFANARYYILKREGADIYTISFASRNVTNDGGLLTANFDGNVIYAKNDFNEAFIPVMVERDTVGKYSRFSSYVGLQNMGIFHEDYRRDAYYLNLTLNNETGEFAKSGWIPAVEEEVLVRGKSEDVDLSNYTYYVFPEASHLYIERYESGLIKPINEWRDTEIFTGYEWAIPDGLEFVYAPIQGGEYYILFEIADTQDNRYCSELIPVHINEPEESGDVAASNDPVTFNWEDGEKCLFVDQNGVKAYLTKSYSAYDGISFAVEVENSDTNPATLYLKEIVLNGNIYTNDDCYIDCDTALQRIAVDKYSYLGLLENLNSIAFILEMTDYNTKETLIKDKIVTITLSDETTVHTSDTNYRKGHIYNSYLNAKADEQTLYDNDGLKITLLGGGMDPLHRYDFTGFLCFENTSNEDVSVSMLTASVNGITLDIEILETSIPAYMKHYSAFRISYNVFFDNRIPSINEMSLTFARWNNYLVGIGSADVIRCDVNLAEKGSIKQDFVEGDTLLFDENNIRATLLGFDEDNYYYYWHLAFVNDSENDIFISANDVYVNGESSIWGLWMPNSKVGAHQKTVISIRKSKDDGIVDNIAFKFLIKNITEDVVLFESDKQIVLYSNNK
ncbi:MAG: hypothetical protein IJC81_01310 [Clostridia bacterium]|nr:hypothetical protein [Clostridia bacterium]